MRSLYRSFAGVATTAAVLVTAAGCEDFLQVRNPTIVDAATIDPTADLPTFSQSARQNFAVAFGWAALYGAWFTGEAYVGDTFPTRNEFGRRTIDYTNVTLNTEVWQPLALAVATNERVLVLAQNAGAVEGNINYARTAMFAGYSILFMAEHFCEGAIGTGQAPGQRYDTPGMLNLAVERFNEAIRVASSITTGAAAAEATSVVNAARVGLARAHLQAGRNAEALAAAQQVPAAFSFTLSYLDDPNFRTRLGNRMYQFTLQREALVVPPDYRAMNDPRVPFNDAGRVAQDGELRFFRQGKFIDWAQPMRLASGLEASYIAAEAQLKQGDPSAALALIAERRAAGSQAAFAGGDTQAILAELMDQRSRDFWLEGKRMGDFRRNPTAVPYVPATGQPYYKAGQGSIGTDTCFPVPRVEVDNNPNFS